MGVHVQRERGVAFDHMLEGIRRGGVIGEGGVDVHERSCSGVGMDLGGREKHVVEPKKEHLRCLNV